jgi:RNA polymerase sigma factor (sigma-70 family)
MAKSRNRTWPDDKAFAYVKKRYDSGESITRNDFLSEDPEGKLVYTLAHETRFGSWRNFLAAMINFYNLKITVKELEKQSNYRGILKRTIFTREEIKTRVKKYYDEGKDVSYSGVLEYDEKLAWAVNKPSTGYGLKHHGYGSWGEVLEDLGLIDVQKLKPQSTIRIIQEIKDLEKEEGLESLLKEIAEAKVPGLVCAAQKSRFFGGWSKAVEAAGYKYGPIRGNGQLLNDSELYEGSVIALHRERRIKERKSMIVSAAEELISTRGKLLRDDLEGKKIIVGDKEYLLLSQIDYHYGGVNNLVKEILMRERTPEKNTFLALMYKNAPSEEILSILQQDNIGFIWSIAKKAHASRIERGLPTLPIGDLVNEGFVGFERALRKYEKRPGASLITYAAYWIRGAINNANYKFSQKQFKERSLILSRNGEEDSLSILDLVEDESQRPGEEAIDRVSVQKVFRILDALPRKIRRVMVMKYKEDKSAVEIAERLGVSRMTVYNLEKEALDFIRKKMGIEIDH